MLVVERATRKGSRRVGKENLMHAGVVSFRFQSGQAEEGLRIYRDSVVPELKEMRGFKGAYLLTNAETGNAYIIGLWETQEDAEGFESSGAYQEQAAKFGDVLAGPPSREIYEVSVQA
jgi:heme-degrading monooxygenase HmoA